MSSDLRKREEICLHKIWYKKVWALAIVTVSVGWSGGPWTGRSQFSFSVRAHTQVAGAISCWDAYEKATNHCFSLTLMFLPPSLSLCCSLSLPSFLSKSNEKNVSWVRIRKLNKESRRVCKAFVSRRVFLWKRPFFHVSMLID